MVYNAILAEMEKQPRGFQKELGLLAGYSTGENFKKALKENRSIEKLDGFIKVIEKLFPENFNDMLMKYAGQLDPKRITLRLLLEYVTLYDMQDLRKLIIGILKKSRKKECIDFAEIYDIYRKTQTKEMSAVDTIRILIPYCASSKSDIKVAAKFTILYCYYYFLMNFKMANIYLNELEEDVKQIKNECLRNSYKGRYFRAFIGTRLHADEIGKLLETKFNIEDTPDPIKTMIYLQIGNSYMIKSYDEAMYYYDKAMECKTSYSEFQIKQSINFASLVWNRLDTFIGDGTKSNELFYYIQSGNKSMAEKTISKINVDELNDFAKAFHYYYLGLLYKDKMYFYKSVESFKIIDERFYRQLPIQELKKMGENDYILSALSA